MGNVMLHVNYEEKAQFRLKYMWAVWMAVNSHAVKTTWGENMFVWYMFELLWRTHDPTTNKLKKMETENDGMSFCFYKIRQIQR